MTVIATDGKTMASDGRSTDRGRMVCSESAEKIRRLPDGRIVGMAGTPYDLGVFCEWLEKGGEFPEFDKDYFDPLVLETDGRVYSYNHRGRRHEDMLPAAVGSGTDLALGAMEAGASPREAVEIACKRQSDCGGRIMGLSLAVSVREAA